MVKSDKKTYVLTREHHTLEGTLDAGTEIELTSEGAAALAGKVRLQTATEAGNDPAEDGGGSPKELAAAKKKVEQLEGDVESLTADKTALETKVKEQEGELEQAATDKTALEKRVQELEGELEEATKPDGDGAGDSGAGESSDGDGNGDTPAEAKKGGKPAGGKGKGK